MIATSYTAAENEIVTAADEGPTELLSARSLAIAAGKAGRLFSICCWCARGAAETTADLDNITHGICPECAKRETGGLR